APSGTLGPSESWALEVLAEEGYAYDASFHRNETATRSATDTARTVAQRTLPNLSPSSLRLWGAAVSPAEIQALRRWPLWLLRHTVSRNRFASDAPFVMHFDVWELDPEQPRISAAGRIARARHYRNLEHTQAILELFLTRQRFASAAEHLKLDADAVP